MPPINVREMRDRIVVLRAERGLSQKEVAAKLGVSRQTILSRENRYNPSLKLVFELALFFEVDLHEVFQYEIEEK